MTHATDVPLICDPVPGPGPCPGVLVCDRMLTEPEITRLKRILECVWTGPGAVYPIEEGVQFHSVFDERQWPDAEFCAA
jgi:hypothetical protein